MRTRILTSALGALLACAAGNALAGQIDPFESCVNVNGAVFDVAAGCFGSDGAAPGNVTDGIDTDTGSGSEGLGSVSITLSEVGDFFVGLFVNWEIDQDANTFFNEGFGSGGAAAAGQSFEVDEPGFGGGGYFGDIFLNFLDGAFDGTFMHDFISGDDGNAPEDISLGLGWDFSLAAGETAVINFLLSDTAPGSGLWLSQNDPLSELTFFLSSTLEITGGETEPPPVTVPEPGTLFLIGSGLLGAALGRRRQTRRY